jgi:integrase
MPLSTVQSAKAGESRSMDNNRLRFIKAKLDELPLPPNGKRTFFYDSDTPGLALLVTSEGRKTFFLYKKVAGKPIQRKIGEYPSMPIDYARRKVNQMLGNLAKTDDPWKQIDSLTKRDKYTLQMAFDRYIRDHAAKRKSVDEMQKKFSRDLGQWSNRNLENISRDEVINLHQKIGKDRGLYAANRMLQLLSAIYNKMIAWDVYAGRNPAIGITKFAETPRARYLKRKELDSLVEKLVSSANRDLHDFVLLSICTGARKSNIYAMRWDEIDLKDATWTSPGEKQKNGQPKVFSLTDREVRILKSRKRGSDLEWVFPSDGEKSGRKSASGHIVDLKKQWMRLRSDAGLPDIHIHDLRRTLASWMVKAGVDQKQVQSALNHKDLRTTAFVYAHADDESERIAKNQTHELMFQGTPLDDSPNVVPLRKKK